MAAAQVTLRLCQKLFPSLMPAPGVPPTKAPLRWPWPRASYAIRAGSENGESKGLWRTSNGGANWERMTAEEISPVSGFNSHLKAVPNKAGNLFFTTGGLDGIDSPFRRSIDGGKTWTDVSGLTRVNAFGFGKAAPGQDYPAIFVAGKRNGEFGIYRSTDNTASWTRIARYPNQSLDAVRAVDGDKDVFGRVFLGFSGSGWAYSIVGSSLAL